MMPSWRLEVWTRGTEHVLVAGPISGTYAEAQVVADARVVELHEQGFADLSYDLIPADMVYSSVPTGWRIDESIGGLVPVRPTEDPLPHAAVRTFKDGSVRVVLEAGLPKIPVVLDLIHHVVKGRLELDDRTEAVSDSVDAARREIEAGLAILFARGVLRSSGEPRCWRRAA